MSKKITSFIKTLLFPCLAITLLLPISARAEQIPEFYTEITIFNDATLKITESIVYDFDAAERHGIFRDIPTNGIKITVTAVADENGEPYRYGTSRASGNLRVQIGDPDKTITGTHTYVITYAVENGLRFFDDHDELYWNLTGDAWPVAISKASAKITLPADIDHDNLKAICYTGQRGSQEQSCAWSRLDELNVAFAATRELNSGEGLTVALSWPPGLVARPAAFELFMRRLDNWYVIILIPIALFLILLTRYRRHYGESQIKKTVIAQYEPPDKLRPAQIMGLTRKRLIPRDITATMIDFAVRGYLKIEEIETKTLWKKTKDWRLIKQNDYTDDPNLTAYEIYLLKKIFGATDTRLISTLKNKFRPYLISLDKQLIKDLRHRDYFHPKLRRVPRIYLALAIGSAVVSVIFMRFSEPRYFMNMLLVAVGLFVIYGLHTRPRHTSRGNETLWQIKGFKEFMKTVHQDRAKFYEQTRIFEELLPYAIAFNITRQWAKNFEGIYTTPPSWYSGSLTAGAFSASSFGEHLNSTLTSFTTGLTGMSSSGFGGGGGAGGGGGGGGGGSW